MIVKLLTEYHVRFLSLTGGCAGLSESLLVQMPHCWKSHVVANIFPTINHKNVIVNYLLILRCFYLTNSAIFTCLIVI